MLKYTIILAAFFMLIKSASSQENLSRQTFSVGDTLPDLPLGLYLTNFADRQATLHDFRGKYVILDFWETFCQPCINALPKIQSLQDHYGDQLQFIAVTSDSEDNVKRLLSRSEVTKDEGIVIPFAIQDGVLQKVFPHRVIPHVIVIDPNGVVRGITHGDEIKEEKIKAMLNGQEVTWWPKNDQLNRIIDNDATPNDDEEDISMVWSSSLGRGGLGSARIIRYEHTNTIKSIRIESKPIDIYYKMFSFFSYGVMGNANLQRIQIDIKDNYTRMRFANKDLTLPFFPDEFPYLDYLNRVEFNNENTYSYTASFPPAIPDSLVLDHIFYDFNKAWPIKGEIVRETKRSYIIRADKDAAKLLRSGGGEPIVPFNHTTVRIKNQPISEFVKVLAWFADGPPIFDESGIEGPIDIEIDFSKSELRNPKRGLIVNNPLDMVVLERQLKRYGLFLVEEEREVPILRIYDEVPGNEKTASRPLK